MIDAPVGYLALSMGCMSRNVSSKLFSDYLPGYGYIVSGFMTIAGPRSDLSVHQKSVAFKLSFI